MEDQTTAEFVFAILTMVAILAIQIRRLPPIKRQPDSSSTRKT